MYKILHIPTASDIYDYPYYISTYLRNNNLCKDDILLVGKNSDDGGLVCFKTKAIAKAYIKSFNWYEPPSLSWPHIVLMSLDDVGSNSRGFPELRYEHLELIHV